MVILGVSGTPPGVPWDPERVPDGLWTIRQSSTLAYCHLSISEKVDF